MEVLLSSLGRFLNTIVLEYVIYSNDYEVRGIETYINRFRIISVDYHLNNFRLN